MITRILLSVPIAFAVMLTAGGAHMRLFENLCNAAEGDQSRSGGQSDTGGSQSSPSDRPINPKTPGGAASVGQPTPMATTSPVATTSSTAPPQHHHARDAGHGMAGHHPSRYPAHTGNSVANQLNPADKPKGASSAPIR